MADLQTVLGMGGAPFAVVWKGTRYPCSFLTLAIIAGFQAWMKEQDLKKITSLKAVLPPEDYDKRLDAAIEQCNNSDRYVFEGTLWKEKYTSKEGIAQMVRLITGTVEMPENDFVHFLIAVHQDVITYLRACEQSIDAIRKDLGITSEGVISDPDTAKKFQAALAARGLI